jgi:hypothetical protein
VLFRGLLAGFLAKPAAPWELQFVFSDIQKAFLRRSASLRASLAAQGKQAFFLYPGT